MFALTAAPVALAALHLKDALLTESGGGLEYTATLLGLSSTRELSTPLRLALMRSDVLLTCVVLPVVLLISSRFLTGVVRVCLIGVINTIGVGILFIELRCYWEVHTFVPLAVMAAGATSIGRAYLPDYLSSGKVVVSLLKFAVLLVSGWLLPIGVAWWNRHAGADGRWVDRLGRGALVLLSLCLLGTLPLYMVSIPPGDPYTTSATAAAIRTFVGGAGGSGLNHLKELETRTPDQLLDDYRRLTNAPVPNGHSPLWGKARGYDVIVLTLETAPQRCVDPERDSVQFPNLARLLPHAFVGRFHYSTYPYTVRAVFSIYSSWYPSNERESFTKALDREHPVLKAPGVVQSAAASGYETEIFVPEAVNNWEHDTVQYAALGFQRQTHPTGVTPPPPTGLDPEQQRLWLRKQLDQETLSQFEGGVRAAIAARRHYLFGLNFQYSHGPWPNAGPHGASPTDSTCAAGRTVFAVEDGWLGQVLDLLKKEGTLDRTLIVVVGDHGIRTRTEHPTFVGGTLNDISYHVPFVLYAPGVISRRTPIDHVTSHIDIAPSVLDLLGIDTGRRFEQGSPMWLEAVRDRTTFFFGRNYLGADGFYAHDSVSRLQNLFGQVARAPWRGSLSFPPNSAGGDLDPTSIVDPIARMTALQDAWATLMIPDRFSRAFAGDR